MTQTKTGRVVITPDDLMGKQEAATFLGLKLESIEQLYKDTRFPVPFAELEAGPVWLRRELLAWQGDKGIDQPSDQKIKQRVTDPMDHILTPASKLDEALRDGKEVRAVCGKVITHKARPNAPVCRKCFLMQFPNVRVNGVH